MKKILSTILSVILLFYVLPTTAMAEEINSALNRNEDLEELLSNPVEVEDVSAAAIIGEVKEKRDEYTKVFKKGDGSYTAMMSAEPLHYLSDGVWENIDNSMIFSGGNYTNNKNEFNVELPKKIDENKKLIIEKDNYSLSFTVDDVEEDSTAVVENGVAVSETGISEADAAIANTQSAVTYNNISENTDLQYIVTPKSIKENIIISNKESVQETYSFTFETDGLVAEKQSDGSVIFKNNENEIKFKIPKPVMMDEKMSFSYDIDVSLVGNSDDSITLFYTPSAEWINDTDRTYPIVIDPAVLLEDNSESWVEDTYVTYDSSNSQKQTQNYYDDYIGLVKAQSETDSGIYPGCAGEIYTKINTNYFKNLGNEIYITEAQYILFSATANGRVYAKKISTPVNLQTVTYENRPILDTNIIDYYTSPANELSVAFPDNTHFNITKPLNDWLNGEKNNGFAIVAGNSEFEGVFTINGTNPNSSSGRVYSTAIVFDYVDLGGYNKNNKYHAQYVGKAGTGYVNDFTQHLTVIRDDISAGGDTMPVEISMVYDAAIIQKIKTIDESILVYGNNWVPNYLRAFVEISDYSLVYYTETGDVVDFVATTDENGNSVFMQTGERDDNYTVNCVPQSNGTQITITRPDGNIESFNNYGLLTSVIDSENNISVNIEYDSNMFIDYITDGSGLKYDFIYSNNLLQKISCLDSSGNPISNLNNQPLEITYTYDETGNLETVTYPDGEAADYVYDDNGNLLQMAHMGEVRTIYEYDFRGRVVNVKNQTRIGFDYADGETLTYERLGDEQIKAIFYDGSYEIYQFNSKGEHTYTFESDSLNVKIGNYLFGETENFISNGDFENGTQNWQVVGNVTTTTATINNKEVNALMLSGGEETVNVLTQTVTISGNKGEEIEVGGWLKGLFVKSSTDNSYLKNIIAEAEEQGNASGFNFTNDRLAQIEIYCNYDSESDTGDETDSEDGNETGAGTENSEPRQPDLIVSFSQNIDDWQFASDKFTLEEDSYTVDVVVRYEKNINPALLSNLVLSKSGFNLIYNENGQLSGMKYGSEMVMKYAYNGTSIDAKIQSATYTNKFANSTRFDFTYSGNNVSNISVNNENKYLFSYDEQNGRLITSVDNRIVRYVDDITRVSGSDCLYDMQTDVYGDYIETINNVQFTTDIDNTVYNAYDGKAIEESEVIAGTLTNGKSIYIKSTQDWYGRREEVYVEGKFLNGNNAVSVKTGYTYCGDDFYDTLNLVEEYKNTVSSMMNNSDFSFAYEYDINGNVIKEYSFQSENSRNLRYSYEYNENSQLIRVNDAIRNETYTYIYDDSGKISQKNIYPYSIGQVGSVIDTVNYEYTGNKLVSYDSKAIIYDNDNISSIGNERYSWADGRLSVYQNGNDTVSFSYNNSDLLNAKTSVTGDETETHIYNWWYGKLVNQTYIKGETSYGVKIVYDSFNSPQGFLVDDSDVYLYLKNAYGDIIGIVDSSGNVVVTYTYDVWGVPTVIYANGEAQTDIAVKNNPLLYRGYFYDNVSGLYLADGRYYNPEIGRFIEADNSNSLNIQEASSTNDLNIYWKNNPLSYINNNENEAYTANCLANYLYNKNRAKEDFIYNQRSDSDGLYRYGFYLTKYMGCGWVATYNAAKMLGLDIMPQDVIREFEMNGVMVYGIMGIHPPAIVSFFKKRGYDVEMSFYDKKSTSFISEFDNAAKQSAVNIVFYLYRTSSNHYVAIKYNDGEFLGYNTFCSNSSVDYLGNSIAFIRSPITNYEYTGRIIISISTK